MFDRDSLQSWGIQGARHTYASLFVYWNILYMKKCRRYKKKHNKNKIDWRKESKQAENK